MHLKHHYRSMQLEDLDTVMQIEPRIYPYPWTKGNFVDSLTAGHTAEVMEHAGEIVAYAVTMMVLDEAHLLNVSVDKPFQGKGLGREMLMRMVDLARNKGALNMFLEVRASNKTAIALYESVGFCEMSIRKAYYRSDNGREDAILMGMAI